MDILFCDLCNESVPQSDLEQGRAFRRSGRIVCQACERSMSEHLGTEARAEPGTARVASEGGRVAVAERVTPQRTRPPGAPGPGRSPIQLGPVPVVEGTAGVLLAVVALLFAVGSTALVVDRVDGTAAELRTAQGATGSELARLGRAVDGFGARLDERVRASEERTARQREDRLAAFTAELEEARAELGSLRSELAAFGTRADTAASDLSRVQRESSTRVDGMLARLSGQDEAARHLEDRLIELEERVRAISQGGGLFAATQAPQAGGAPAWQPLLPDLSNAQPPVRLEAIYALGETSDQAVVPYLVPMLQDLDLFVRMAAARVLEDLQARSAVPALIDALEDPEPPVTESAMFALRKITGKNFGFEPNESASERARKIKLWRQWWNAEGEAFLAGN